MPHVITSEADLVRLELTGTLTRENLLAALREIRAAEDAYDRAPNRLTILIDVEARQLKTVDVAAVAERRKAMTLRNDVKSAFVATRAVSYGFVRMFQMLNDHPQIRTEIFGSEEAARAWLAEP